MITKIQIPLAFENMEEATIGEWLVEVGQQVKKEQSLCELITEKTTFEFPSPVEGVLRLIVLPTKSVAAVGEIICLIGAPEDELPDLESLKDTSSGTPDKSTFKRNAVSGAAKSTSAKRSERIRATPAARRAARERGISLEKIAAAFPDKVLIEDDVTNYKDNE